LTDYSFEARDLLNPQATTTGDIPPTESSSLASASLAFALLPALAGALFKNGSAIATDLMLLGLAGIFLHWSVTQPWNWYHSAQGIRVRHELDLDVAVEEESDLESSDEQRQPRTPLDDLPEEESTESTPKPSARTSQLNSSQKSALSELYRYELLALFACLAFPLLSAYLLHAIRSQLSRPSEGLVSNYNLTIFTMISELRVFSHIFKLLQSRTLHLQRIVHANPYGSSKSQENEQLNAVLERLGKLEDRNAIGQTSTSKDESDTVARLKQNATLARDIRSSLQPEVDALNRAVRRYEKKTGVLQFQTESRLSAIEARLDDAIALAAAAAKNSASHRNVLAWALEYGLAILLFPVNALLQILLLPLKSIRALVNRRAPSPPPTKSTRTIKLGKASGQPRYSVDRVPIRVTKR